MRKSTQGATASPVVRTPSDSGAGSRRRGDEKLAESLDLLGVTDPHPPPDLLAQAWMGLRGDVAAMCHTARLFWQKNPWNAADKRRLDPDLGLHWLELAAAKVIAQPKFPRIKADDVISAIEAFTHCPHWAAKFLCAPDGARWRMALSFYFSEFVNAKDNPYRPMPDFPMKEYRIVRKELESTLSLKDLVFLISKGAETPAAIRHFKDILKRKTGRR